MTKEREEYEEEKQIIVRKQTIPSFLHVLSITGGLIVAILSAWVALSTKITKVESQVENDRVFEHENGIRVEYKLDQLIEKVLEINDKVIELKARSDAERTIRLNLNRH